MHRTDVQLFGMLDWVHDTDTLPYGPRLHDFKRYVENYLILNVQLINT